jgi:hypothetical protein
MKENWNVIPFHFRRWFSGEYLILKYYAFQQLKNVNAAAEIQVYRAIKIIIHNNS